MSDAPPLGRLVPVEPPRRIALVPLDEEGEDVDDDPEPRLVADEPDDEEPELLDPDELDPLDGGAVRTGCCSENDGVEYVGAVYVGAA